MDASSQTGRRSGRLAGGLAVDEYRPSQPLHQPCDIVYLMASPPILMSCRPPSLERGREVVAELEVVLAGALRVVVRRTDGIAGERDARRAALDFAPAEDANEDLRGARRTPAAGRAPSGQRLERVVVRVEAALDLVDRVVAQHLRVIAEVLIDEAVVRARRGRMVVGAAAAADRLDVLVVAVPHGEPVLRVDLRVNLGAALVQLVLDQDVLVEVVAGAHERAAGAAEGERLRIALVLPVAEEVDAVLDDRPADRAADLLIRIRRTVF